MKKQLFLAGLALFLTAPAFAQSGTTTVKDPVTGAKTTTEVKVRDNGTVRVKTDERTGRTEAGEKINNTAQDTKQASKKVANGTERIAKKAAHGTKEAGKDVGHGAKKAGKAVGNTAEKGADKVKDAVD